MVRIAASFSLFLAVIAAFIGCSNSKDSEAEALRAEVERLKSQRSDEPSASNAAPTSSGATAAARPSVVSPLPRAPVSPVKPAAATLEVEIIGSAGQSFGSPGPWLYIDRKLVRKVAISSGSGPHRETLTLVPGTYLVEIAVAPEPGVEGTVPAFAFSLESQTVTLAPNGHALVSLMVRPLYSNTYRDYVALWADPKGLTEQWIRQFDRRSVMYSEDLLVAALRAASARIKARRPEKPFVMLDLPEKHGGPREVDVDQLRLLVDWLKSSYWTDWPNYSRYSAPDDASDQVRQAYALMATLDDKVRRKREQIDELKGVARELEEATRGQQR